MGTSPYAAYLVCAGAPLERHLPHVLAVVLGNTARPDQGRHQVVLYGLELRGPDIPLRKRERVGFCAVAGHEGGPSLIQQHGDRTCVRAAERTQNPHPGEAVQLPPAGVTVSCTCRLCPLLLLDSSVCSPRGRGTPSLITVERPSPGSEEHTPDTASRGWVSHLCLFLNPPFHAQPV